jgi:protein-tyrosine phosphatase
MKRNPGKTSVLFVCMGNICRSPTAEGVFRHVVESSGLGDAVHVDSAGTHGYHVGEPPDGRSQAAAARRGYSLATLRARRFEIADFDRFDYVLAMDRDNLAYLESLAGPAHRQRLKLFLTFAEGLGLDVPDPYYGGAAGFERVLDMVEEASRGLLETLRSRLLL